MHGGSFFDDENRFVLPAYVKMNIIAQVAVFSIIFVAGTIHAASRGRSHVIHSKLLSDQGSLLRGVRYGLDYGESLPPKQRILEMSSNYGLNALHVYLEKYDTPTGRNAAKADSLVKWTEEAGMYLILTIGCGSHNGHFDRRQALEFWKFYAPRYGMRTHVIYELHNEPEFTCNASYRDSTIRLQAELYDLIRASAPKTLVLLLGYSNVPHPSLALVDIRKLKKVDWSNAAVAYHGYYWCGKEAQEADSLRVLQKAGYALINTEFRDKGDWVADAKRYEALGIGWMNFQYLQQGATMDGFRRDVEAGGVVWKPDFGDWPRSIGRTRSSPYGAGYF